MFKDKSTLLHVNQEEQNLVKKVRELHDKTLTRNRCLKLKFIILLWSLKRSYNKKKLLYVERWLYCNCDRFVDSSVYQSYGRGLSKQDIIDINKYATDGLEPDLTLYYKVDNKLV